MYSAVVIDGCRPPQPTFPFISRRFQGRMPFPHCLHGPSAAWGSLEQAKCGTQLPPALRACFVCAAGQVPSGVFDARSIQES